MKKRLFLPVLLVVFTIICSSALAQNQGDGTGGGNSRRTEAGLESGSAGGDNAEGDELKSLEKTRTREQIREQICDQPCYEGKDGEKYEWKKRHNTRLVKYEKEGDVETLNKYLYRIVNRSKFRKSEDKEGFVKWALENRPWNIES